MATVMADQLEADTPDAIDRRSCEEVCVGDLAVAVQPGPVDHGSVEQARRARPELVMFAHGRRGEQGNSFGWRDRARIPRLADDADEAILCDRARRPTTALTDVALHPSTGVPMVDGIAAEEGDQDVDVEERSPQTGPSARRRSISALERLPDPDAEAD